MDNNILRNTVTTGLLMAGATGALAQGAPAEPKWESSAGVGLTLTAGNTDTILVTGQLQTQRKGPQNEWYFGLDGAYGENEGDKNNETLHGFGQFNHLFTERLFGFVRADGLHDGIALVDYRFTLSAGLGYYLIKNEKTSLSFEAGPGYVFERLDGDENDYMTIRFAERFEHKLNDKTRIWQSVEFLPEIEDWGSHVINAELGIETTISGNLKLRAYLQDTYDSTPAAGREHNDLKLVTGLAYTF